MHSSRCTHGCFIWYPYPAAPPIEIEFRHSEQIDEQILNPSYYNSKYCSFRDNAYACMSSLRSYILGRLSPGTPSSEFISPSSMGRACADPKKPIYILSTSYDRCAADQPQIEEEAIMINYILSLHLRVTMNRYSNSSSAALVCLVIRIHGLFLVGCAC